MSAPKEPHSAPEVVQPGLEAVPPSRLEPYYAPTPEKYGPYIPPATENKQRICGLAPKAFWLVIFIIVVILAAAIGGGVGGGLAAQNKSDSSSQSSATAQAQSSSAASRSGTISRSTPTGTRSSATSSAASSVPTSGCNSTDGTIFTPADANDEGGPYTINGTSFNYKIYCYTNYASKNSGWNSGVTAVVALRGITTLQDCIRACATYNVPLAANVPSFDDLCSGAVWQEQEHGPKCWLQSGMVDGNLTDVYFGTIETDSAVLQWDV